MLADAEKIRMCDGAQDVPAAPTRVFRGQTVHSSVQEQPVFPAAERAHPMTGGRAQRVEAGAQGWLQEWLHAFLLRQARLESTPAEEPRALARLDASARKWADSPGQELKGWRVRLAADEALRWFRRA